MHQLNTGRTPRFAAGGYVDSRNTISTTGLGQTTNGDLNANFSKLIEISASIRDALQKQTSGNNTSTTHASASANTPTTNVSINISVTNAANGQTTNTASATANQTGGSATGQNSNNKQDTQSYQKLAKMMQENALQVIVREQRPGGLLYNSAAKSSSGIIGS